jgi:pilus assembly protein CpaB
MRTRTMLAFTILASLLVAVFVLLSADFSGSSVAAVPNEKTQPVLVAARPLEAGALIQPQDLRWEPMSIDSLPVGRIERPLTSVVKQDGPAEALAQTQVIGAVLRRDATVGSPILNDNVIRPGDRDFLVAVLQPNMRAISVAVNAVSGAAGLIYPGDRVDVLLTQSFTSGDFPLAKRAVGETVVEDLRVLAIDQRVQGKPESGVAGDGRIARTVTLEASPSQAQKITVATELGRISLSLRSLNVGSEDKLPRDGSGQSIWADDVSPALKSRGTAPKPTPVASRSVVQVMRGSKVETLEHQN